MRHSLLLPTFAAVIALVAVPAAAQMIGGDGPPGDCESNPDGCGNQNPPPQPSLGASTSTIGSYRVYFGGDQHDGFISGDQNSFVSTYFGAGPYRPVGGPTLTVGSSGSNASFTPTYTPEASVATSASSDGTHSAEGGISVFYLVELHAANAAAYAALTPLLGTSGAIAQISGHYTLAASRAAYSIASAVTGINISLDQSLQKSMGSICDFSGYYDSNGTNCHTANYALDLNFVAGSTFTDGDPYSIYGSIELNTEAHAGPTGLGVYAGDSSAFIDPTITFNPLFTTPLYTVNIGNQVQPVAGGGTVPEPATWALMLGGFGLAGAALRRQRTALVRA